MRTILSHIRTLAIAIAVCLAFGAAVPCQASESNEYEAAFLARINEARQDPTGVAARLGVTLDSLIDRFPDLHDALTNGMSHLTLSPRLTASAAEHALDLIEKGYYSKISQDGRTVEDRMLEAGYLPAEADEAIGMIGFNNFLDPNMAVDAIFESLFREQVNSGDPIFLNPEFKDVGISFRSGTMPIGGKLQNVYLTTLDFGKKLNVVIEKAIGRLINEIRREPELITSYSPITRENWERRLGDNSWVMEQWLAPLADNEILYRAAKGHARDLVRRVYFDSISPEGKTPEIRVDELGYEASYMDEIISALIVDDFGEDPFNIGKLLLSQMLAEEYYGDGLPIILSSEVSEIGISVETFSIKGGEGNLLRGFIVVADLAKPSVDRLFLVGNVFQDKVESDIPTDFSQTMAFNQGCDATYPPIVGGGNNNIPDDNRNFNLGEGLQGVTVSLLPLDGEKGEVASSNLLVAETDQIGGFQLPITDDWYEVSVVGTSGEALGAWIMSGKSSNYHKDFQVR